MIITVVTVDAVVKFAAIDPNRAEQYADNMRKLYPDEEVVTWNLPLEEQA